MNMNSFKRLPNKTQGIIFLLFGLAMILLYTFGVLQKSLTLVVLVLAVISLLAGCKKLEIFHKIGRMLHRHK